MAHASKRSFVTHKIMETSIRRSEYSKVTGFGFTRSPVRDEYNSSIVVLKTIHYFRSFFLEVTLRPVGVVCSVSPTALLLDARGFNFHFFENHSRH